VWIRGFVFFLFFALTYAAFSQAPADEPQTGDEIARELRNMQPGGNTEVSGNLIINRHEKIPVVCNITTNGDSWKVVYKTERTANTPAEKFITIHTLNGPNKYFYSSASSPAASLPEPKLLSSAEVAIPFAGSDFWLSELGFDFLHWPSQKKLPGQMRLGQACYVLESIDPKAPVVVRVKSYIDKDSGGILIAEGYDRNKKLIKEFSLGGGSFKKVNGQWQLKKMKISSPKEDSETVLEFDLPDESGK
jgi:hypothetical protein